MIRHFFKSKSFSITEVTLENYRSSQNVYFLHGTADKCDPRPPVSGFRNLIYRYLVGLLDRGIDPSQDHCLHKHRKNADTHHAPESG
jgi:hypothetical protein